MAEHAGVDVDAVSGAEFEGLLSVILTRLGYAVQLTPHFDYVDLILTRDGTPTAVEAKRHAGVIGHRAVQKVVAGCAARNCSEATVVTNSLFQSRTKTLARANGVVLWDRTALIDRLLPQTSSRP